MRRLALIPAACAILAASPALAGPVSLWPEVSDSDGRVTLGDIFEGAGAASDILVANRTGPTVVLDALAVQQLARRSGLDWDNSQGIRRIIVRAGAGPAPVSTTADRAGAASAARGNVEILTWARNLNPGEVIQPQDLVWGKAVGAAGDAPRDPDAVIGMSVRRPLREGAPVSMRDIAAQQAVKRGELVNVTWSDGSITLTLQGKAVTDAAVGQTFSVQNLASKKIVEAVAVSPGQAVTGPEAQRLKAAALYAAR
ncbi:flagellar basal body P-ring formation chaperone FlgA [Caulobacter mirabilis]|uniref:Flagella basal body P-ring formation protein FlgA n=1 Tax=Caulobacter mirabilis TaxID=69666 RepID=A0A2D2B0C1_9CAUL|nr:flagellar basal body P-ring formation chaperone FlgA [Caulobacter mirabilis]ATQ43712.1 flagella basal body P-ring formation protein FlgA [Caulobacter mirabilis]